MWEEPPDTEASGANPVASAWDWNEDIGSVDGLSSVAGETVNATAAYDSYEERFSDAAAYKLGLLASPEKKANFTWTPSGLSSGWYIISFWFYDNAGWVSSRRGFVGVWQTKTTPRCGILWHPGHATLPANYIFVNTPGAWPAFTEETDTGVARSDGWHHVLFASKRKLAGSTYHESLLVMIDGYAQIEDSSSSGTPTLAHFGNARFGMMYDGDYATNPAYLDSVRAWNPHLASTNRGYRYSTGDVTVYFPPATIRERVKSFDSSSQSQDTSGIDRRGSVGWYYRISTDGGATYGATKGLYALPSETPSATEEYTIQPIAVMSSRSTGLKTGMMSPRLNSLSISYTGIVSELAPSSASWTEETGSASVWTETSPTVGAWTET
jgi:hypothetical protein